MVYLVSRLVCEADVIDDESSHLIPATHTLFRKSKLTASFRNCYNSRIWTKGRTISEAMPKRAESAVFFSQWMLAIPYLLSQLSPLLVNSRRSLNILRKSQLSPKTNGMPNPCSCGFQLTYKS